MSICLSKATVIGESILQSPLKQKLCILLRSRAGTTIPVQGHMACCLLKSQVPSAVLNIHVGNMVPDTRS